MQIRPMTERYSVQISGIVSCFDRVVIKGTLQCFDYVHEMTSYLYINNIKIFDFPKFADPLRMKIRENAEKIAAENNLEIEYIKKNNFRKEERIKEIIKERGEHPGLVHIYFNGHNLLASKLDQHKIKYQMLENAFIPIYRERFSICSKTI